MRLVIDMQGAQSIESRNRGIGRYSLALSREMARLRCEHNVVFALNGLFSETIEPIRAAFAGLVPEENICVWEAAAPVNALDPSNDARRQVAEISREAFLASLRPDVVLNTSIFEGLEGGAVTSIGCFTTQLPTVVVLYDLIPLIYRSLYLQNPVVERWYLNKLDHLRRADLLLSISSSSRQEAVDYLNFPAEKVVNISTACDSRFQPAVVDKSGHAQLQMNYGLVRPFVMYTGGIDHRKNIEGLIRAYAGMPRHIRVAHQLAVVCSIKEPDRKLLLRLAHKEGLGDDELVITGFVSDNDLLMLCNACKLFVFPSWHEGFGLPALEAMACGRAVIGSNKSSIPEVIGREDALFDPLDDRAITRKMVDVLTNEDFRAELAQYGLERAKSFSWERTARRAWQALEAFVAQRSQSLPVLSVMTQRPRLAYISPLPPEQSGIADYSAALLPELARHYEVEVIVSQSKVSDPWVRANCPMRDVNWFRANARRFDRVLYHFGNSPFHSHMFDLLGELPGVVVLHDFFLAHAVGHVPFPGAIPTRGDLAFVHSHGWSALHARYAAKDVDEAVWAYPCNLEVLQNALGVIVHSDYSCSLARQWYGSHAADAWSQIPLVRATAVDAGRPALRQALGIGEKDFIVCSFGLLGATKLNHRLLAAWLASPLAGDPRCRLIFVGRNPGGDYADQLAGSMHGSASRSLIEITGWADAAAYRAWLAAADIGVQLRTRSRGETSAAVLDCMNHGLATIVNAHGSTADVPTDAVWMLPDEFSEDQLIEALTALWRDDGQRQTLGRRAREVIYMHHQPRQCADQYAQAIENHYQKAMFGLPAVIDAIANVEPPLQPDDWPRVSSALANNFPPRPRRKQLFLDVSILAQNDAKSGIQRVVRALLRELLLNPPDGWAVEPVYAAADTPGYRYAHLFTSRFLDINNVCAEDKPVDTWPGDVFVGLDLQHVVVPLQKDYLLAWHRRGTKIFFIVYDLLPILFPHFFQEATRMMHERWLETISHFDGAVCISRAVADELHAWIKNFGTKRERRLGLSWFHLGANVENTVPTTGMPNGANQTLNAIKELPSFLAVGTVEPRKGYTQILAAFEQLWSEGVDANLIIVGNQGWKMEALAEKLSAHRERGKHLFWLEGISDEYLEKIYAASTCLIAASEGEGFGLPLIEAAHHRLPIIARDIPVFREVAGDHAFYFKGLEPQALRDAVRQWLELDKQGKAPQSDNMPRQTWKQSAEQLLKIVLGGQGQSAAGGACT